MSTKTSWSIEMVFMLISLITVRYNTIDQLFPSPTRKLFLDPSVGNSQYNVFKFDFDIKEGKILILIKDPSGEPLQAFERLCWQNSISTIEIDNLNKLEDRVQITTPKAALSFVRLRTSPRTYHCFISTQKSWQVEIIPKQNISADLMFGDNKRANWLRKVRNGYLGIIDASLAKHLDIPPAKCIQSGNGFVITRTLVVKDLGSEQPYFVNIVEWVGRNGEYIIRRRNIIKQRKELSVKWYFPSFE